MSGKEQITYIIKNCEDNFEQWLYVSAVVVNDKKETQENHPCVSFYIIIASTLRPRGAGDASRRLGVSFNI